MSILIVSIVPLVDCRFSFKNIQIYFNQKYITFNDVKQQPSLKQKRNAVDEDEFCGEIILKLLT